MLVKDVMSLKPTTVFTVANLRIYPEFSFWFLEEHAVNATVISRKNVKKKNICFALVYLCPFTKLVFLGSGIMRITDYYIYLFIII